MKMVGDKPPRVQLGGPGLPGGPGDACDLTILVMALNHITHMGDVLCLEKWLNDCNNQVRLRLDVHFIHQSNGGDKGSDSPACFRSP